MIEQGRKKYAGLLRRYASCKFHLCHLLQYRQRAAAGATICYKALTA